MVKLRDEFEVENTRKKLARLQAKYDQLAATPARNETVRQDTLRSLKTMIDQMLSEIAEYQRRIGQKAPSRTAGRS